MPAPGHWLLHAALLLLTFNLTAFHTVHNDNDCMYKLSCVSYRVFSSTASFLPVGGLVVHHNSLACNLPSFPSKVFLVNSDVCISISRQNNDCHSSKAVRQKYHLLIILLLLMSGNVKSNPGPTPPGIINLSTPSDFKERNGLGLLHMNIRSLVPKLDFVKAWVFTSDPDILVVSETWLNKSVLDSTIQINGYNIFRSDRQSKGGGVAIYVKTRFTCRVTKSIALPKLFEFLSIDISLSPTSHISVVGCYKAPSASKEAELKRETSRVYTVRIANRRAESTPLLMY